MILATAILVFSSSKANATITLGGYSFENNAFADEVLDIYGTWIYDGPAKALLGANITYATVNWPYDENAYIRVAFTDNSIVNGPGTDLILFETSAGQTLGCPARITISGITNTYDTHWLGPGDLHAAIVNLDDFSVAPGGRVSTITLWGGANDTDYMGLGALNNGAPIPEPATLFLLTLGGLILRRRK